MPFWDGMDRLPGKKKIGFGREVVVKRFDCISIYRFANLSIDPARECWISQ